MAVLPQFGTIFSGSNPVSLTNINTINTTKIQTNSKIQTFFMNSFFFKVFELKITPLHHV